MSYTSTHVGEDGLTVNQRTAVLQQHADQYKADAAAQGGEVTASGNGSGAPPAGTPRPPGLPDGEVEIFAGGHRVAGWTDVEISGGLDRAPASFGLGMTERYPGEAQSFPIKPGDACEIRIGGDTVLVGYVNRRPRSLAASQHMIRLEGRSRVQDLVDCSAMVASMSLVNQSIASVAGMLVPKFAGPIAVLTPDGDGDGKAYQISITLGETPYEIISQVASYEGLLVHDDARGNLVISRVGKTLMASGFTEGENVQAAEATDDDSHCYSEYVPALFAQDSLAQIGPGGNKAGNPVKDPLVLRYRPLIVISDQSIQGVSLAQKRAAWEATRRRGRARSVSLTTDSWRDSAGMLWTHNMLAPVHIPTLDVVRQTWIIAEWSFKRSAQGGTTASIVLMPPEAFAIAPSALDAVSFQISQASAEGQRAAAVGTPASAPAPATAPNANANPKAGEGYGI